MPEPNRVLITRDSLGALIQACYIVKSEFEEYQKKKNIQITLSHIVGTHTIMVSAVGDKCFVEYLAYLFQELGLVAEDRTPIFA